MAANYSISAQPQRITRRRRRRPIRGGAGGRPTNPERPGNWILTGGRALAAGWLRAIFNAPLLAPCAVDRPEPAPPSQPSRTEPSRASPRQQDEQQPAVDRRRAAATTAALLPGWSSLLPRPAEGLQRAEGANHQPAAAGHRRQQRIAAETSSQKRSVECPGLPEQQVSAVSRAASTGQRRSASGQYVGTGSTGPRAASAGP